MKLKNLLNLSTADNRNLIENISVMNSIHFHKLTTYETSK